MVNSKENSFCVMTFMWFSSESLGSRITRKWQICGNEEGVELLLLK